MTVFLNSSVFQFVHTKLFGELKVLKGNLTELPIPRVSKEDDELLTRIGKEILAENGPKRPRSTPWCFRSTDLRRRGGRDAPQSKCCRVTLTVL